MTKICVSSSGTDLDAPVNPRFGRCNYFMMVDSDTMKFEAIPNEAMTASGGAGIKAAQTVVAHEAEVVITGSVGPNALPALQDGGVEIMTGTFSSIRDAVEAYKKGTLSSIDAPGPAHRGMGIGRGTMTDGTGFGGGSGFGGGYGRGGGHGGGRGRGHGGGRGGGRGRWSEN